MANIELLEVSGEGCANCFSLLPLLNKLAAERGIPLRHLEVTEENAEAVRKYEIDRVPTVLVLKDGEVTARCSGYQPEEILSLWLDAKISDARL